mmetsp:Transcript_22499/g.56434  ORF Transcript_22499/g.56434 Transcript_22499/m.56434 type:complete len:218 (-) Transcript_22499:181-834(-)
MTSGESSSSRPSSPSTTSRGQSPSKDKETVAAPTTTYKRRRIKISDAQLSFLQLAFARNNRPSFAQREAIAAVVGMTTRQVQVWFQNRRSKRRGAIKPWEGGYQYPSSAPPMQSPFGASFQPKATALQPSNYQAPLINTANISSLSQQQLYTALTNRLPTVELSSPSRHPPTQHAEAACKQSFSTEVPSNSFDVLLTAAASVQAPTLQKMSISNLVN